MKDWLQLYQKGGAIIPEITVYSKKKYLDESKAQQEKYLADMAKYKQDSAQWVEANRAYQDSLKLYSGAKQQWDDEITATMNKDNQDYQALLNSSFITEAEKEHIRGIQKKGRSLYYTYDDLARRTGKSGYDYDIPPKSMINKRDGNYMVKFDNTGKTNYPITVDNFTAINLFKDNPINPISVVNVGEGDGYGIYKKPNEVNIPQKPTKPNSPAVKYDNTYENLKMRSLWANKAKQDSTAKIGVLNPLEYNDESKGFTIGEAMKFPKEIRDKYNIDYIAGQVQKKQQGGKTNWGNEVTDFGSRMLHGLQTFGGSYVGDFIQGFSPKAAETVKKYTAGMIAPTPKEYLESNRDSWNNRVSNIANATSMALAGEMAGPLLSKGSKSLGKVIPKKFKSEINWGNWNPETPNHPELIKEYNTIEKSTKKAGTWMKNSDGSSFEGLPEQFIQQNSSWFKKAYPEGATKAYRGSHFHVQDFTNRNRNDYATFFTDQIDNAKAYTREPNRFHTPFDKSREMDMSEGVYEVALPNHYKKVIGQGNGQNWRFLQYDDNIANNTTTNFYAKNHNEELAHVFSKGKDYSHSYPFPKDYNPTDKYLSTDIYANYVKNPNNTEGIAQIDNVVDTMGDRYLKSNTVFAVDAQKVPIKSLRHNVGFFDMSNPNIYKSLIPAGVFGASQIEKKQSGGKTDWLENFKEAMYVGWKRMVGPGQGKVGFESVDMDDLLPRQGYKESTFLDKHVKGKNKAGAIGIAQIKQNTLKDYPELKGFNLRDPEQGVQAQKVIMDDLMSASFIDKPYQPDSITAAKGLGAYNWGRGNLSSYLNSQKKKGVDIYNTWDWLNDLPTETKDYINKVLRGKDPKFEKNFKAVEDHPYMRFYK